MRVFVRAVILIAFFLFGPAYAEDDVDKLISEIKSNSDRFAKLRPLLNDPDLNVRLSAFDVMVEQNDSSLRNLAIGAAFAAEESTLKARALEELLLSRKNLVFVFTDAPHNKLWLEKLGGQFSLPVVHVSRDARCLSFTSSGGECDVDNSMIISGVTASLRSSRVVGVMTGQFYLNDQGQLEGSLSSAAMQTLASVKMELF